MPARARVSVLLMAILLAAVVFSGATGNAQTAPPAAPSATAAKVAQLLQESGYQFTKQTDEVWFIPYHGNSLKDFRVVLAVQEDMLVTFTRVASKAQIPANPEFLREVLRFDHRLDFVKVGIDDDDDLFVRADAHPRVLDLSEFKALVEQVAAATDEVHKGVSPMLKAAGN